MPGARYSLPLYRARYIFSLEVLCVEQRYERSGASFVLEPEGPYDFLASVQFLEGFAPAGYKPAERPGLRIAFPVDGTWEPGGALVMSAGSGASVRVECFGEASPDTVRDQVRRILSLDVDATGYPEVLERDPVLRVISAQYPGLRPVLFYSSYEAAAWAIICSRIRMTQAAGIKARMARELGTGVDVGGDLVHAFPAPQVLQQLESFPGLFGRKIDYLRALGDSAERGMLDVDHLRSMEFDDAKRHLMGLSGIGPFSAELILLRSVATVDWAPAAEPRFARAVRLAYGLSSDPGPDQIAGIAQGWAPFRTWVSVLLRSTLADIAR